MSVAVHVMCLCLCLSCSNESRNASINFGTNSKQNTTKLCSALFRTNMAWPALTFALGSRLKGGLFVPHFADEPTSICLHKADV
jgi:H+/Cl- antiporter ClcA